LNIGLPTGPKEALHVEQEMQGIDFTHNHDEVCLLTDTAFNKSRHFPGTGDPQFDKRFDLSDFVSIGKITVADGLGRGNTAYICIAGRKRHVYTIDATPTKGMTGYLRFNSRLSRYLASLLAYKQWIQEINAICGKRTNRKDFPESRARKHLAEMERRLKEIEPRGFKKNYWNYLCCLEGRRFML